MTKDQFSAALTIAKSKVDLSNVDDSILDGCGLHGFVPVTVSLEACAKCIRWHAFCLNGQIDSEALNELRSISRKRWLIA